MFPQHENLPKQHEIIPSLDFRVIIKTDTHEKGFFQFPFEFYFSLNSLADHTPRGINLLIQPDKKFVL
jgi:hypothetical protein